MKIRTYFTLFVIAAGFLNSGCDKDTFHKIRFIVMPTQKDKVQSCQILRSIINTQVEKYYFKEGTWPKDDLSDIKTNANYFPNGILTCPVDGSTYYLSKHSIHGSVFQLVVGHKIGQGTHTWDGYKEDPKVSPNEFLFQNAGPTKKDKVQKCSMNRSYINSQIWIYHYNEKTWPKDDLSDIKTNANYFPDGIPTCPVDEQSYHLSGSPNHRIAGHQEGHGTHKW